MSLTSFTPHLPVSLNTLTPIGLKWYFVGVDLAPNDSLETGLSVLDRERQLVRMEKVYTDEDLLRAALSLGPAENLLVALDIPKSLSISGKWRQEEVKMHPLRLKRKYTGEIINRHSERANQLYDRFREAGITSVFYFNDLAKLRYELLIPYRTRTPQGCRAMQSIIKTRFQIPNMPQNLAPSSVLDAMIGAYASWTLYKTQEGKHFDLVADEQGRIYILPQRRHNALPG